MLAGGELAAAVLGEVVVIHPHGPLTRLWIEFSRCTHTGILLVRSRSPPDPGRFTYPGQQLHLVMDNYASHKTPEVKAWLAEHTNFHVHFTPTSASWLNVVEIWFGIIDRQAIRRGTFTSVADFNAKIRAFITGWNDRKHPFVWTKAADEILTKAQPIRTL